jgi:hypothetical protein
MLPIRSTTNLTANAGCTDTRSEKCTPSSRATQRPLATRLEPLRPTPWGAATSTKDGAMPDKGGQFATQPIQFLTTSYHYFPPPLHPVVSPLLLTSHYITLALPTPMPATRTLRPMRPSSTLTTPPHACMLALPQGKFCTPWPLDS